MATQRYLEKQFPEIWLEMNDRNSMKYGIEKSSSK